ncbi:MAG TPA: twin-arginine translocase subunit TatC [Candidatus Saccharimonadales bacterium]|nr:twin-arginine translocase subunit TatC [Candidatus Saccharimonadales bacterium]
MTAKTQQRLQTVQTTRPNKNTFAAHLGEIRRRLFLIALVFVAASTLAYSYHDQLTQIIMYPLHGEKLVYLTPGGGFNFIFQISMYVGILAAAPFVVYHLYGFIRPALPKRAQRSSVAVVVAAALLMAVGVAYGYVVAVPSALQFLSTFAGDAVTPNLTADSYLSFFLTYIAGLALLFQLPIFLLFIHWVKPLTPMSLLKTQRWVILGVFIVAALITPTPDVYNQCMIAVPLLVVYELGVILVLATIYKKRRSMRMTGEVPA